MKKTIFSSQNLIINKLNIRSSNLIFLEDYNSTYIKLHFEIIRKFSLYKLLKSNNYNESKFLEVIKKKNDYYIELARELLYNDDEAMVKFFKVNTNEQENNLRKVFNNNHNINSYVSNYTVEGFYYKYINQFLRKGDFDSFRLLSNHISKFVYHLLEYRKTINQDSLSTLYRAIFITQNEFKLYQNSIGKIICYPSFTSTSLKNNFCPFQNSPNTLFVKLVIQQNNCKSIICIKDLSAHPQEEEYLCLPFTFFKITNIEFKTENNIHYNIIYLTALNSEKTIEEMFLDYMENETDNLDPEGLQMLRLINNDTTLILNEYLKSKYYKKYQFNF